MPVIRFIMIAFGLMLTTTGFAQTQDTISLEQKFTDLIEGANNFKQYKVVEEQKLRNLQEEVKVQLMDLKEDLKGSRSKIKMQSKENADLQRDLKQVQIKLNQERTAKDQIQFLGLDLNKSSFQVIFWVSLGVLILVIVILILKIKRNGSEKRKAEVRLKQEQREYEDFRKKSLDKQQKLGRKLQDEINKNKKKNNSDL